MKTIILTGGGTAGHIAPNLALLPYLTNYDVHYCGEADSMEERMVSAYKSVTFHALPCIKFSRSNPFKNIKVPFVLSSGIRKAKKLIEVLRPNVVFSKGGYAALPAAMAAYKKGVPLVIHESDRSMGLSNRLVAKKSKYVCTSFASLAEKYKNGIFTGTPLRRELYTSSAENINKKFGFAPNGSNLLIFGGSQGALAINNCVESAADALCARFNVLHITGKNPTAVTHANYRQIEFCDFMADCYAWADYAICRAGAGALAEIVALKIPSLVIPLPKSGSSRGDQEQNAKYYADKGCVTVLPQSELAPDTLVRGAQDLIAKRSDLLAAMARIPSPDGTARIAEILKSF